jgi:hypothetical protein
MVIAEISGGLGNQMFQYAAARSLAIKLNAPLYLDLIGYEYKKDDPFNTPRPFELDRFCTSFELLTPALRKQLIHASRFQKLILLLKGQKPKWYKQKTFAYDNSWEQLEGPVYLSGLWQTEKYFINHADIIRKDFVFKQPLDTKTISCLNEIKNCNSVSVHFRRGDYVRTKEVNAFHGTPPVTYYQKAVQKILAEKPDSRFFVFSDDPEWVRENFLPYYPDSILVDWNNGTDSWKDMLLMQSCLHNIIANSSFSWWGAWLNQNPGKICIAPSPWFQHTDEFYTYDDVVPPNWKKIKYDC